MLNGLAYMYTSGHFRQPEVYIFLHVVNKYDTCIFFNTLDF